MLYLITGKPGAGKTLRALWQIEKLRKESGRQVFYDGISDLKLPWTECSAYETPEGQKVGGAGEWYKLPDTSIVVIDECQRIFPNRPRGSKVPKLVSELETHRHRGFDIFLITQDPKIIDSHVRKLVQKHLHVRRVYGAQAAHIFQWENEVRDPSSKNDLKDALDSYWKYPKDVYEWYHSAEVHTVERSLPKKWLVAIAVMLVGVPLLVWVGIRAGKHAAGTDKSVPVPSKEAASSKPVFASNLDRSNPWNPQVRSPRIRSVAASAPLYDELQKAVSQPRIAGCLSLVLNGDVHCECTSQQGSVLPMSTRECLAAVKNGWFDPTRSDVDVRAENIAYLNARDAQSSSASVSEPHKESSGSSSSVPIVAGFH